MRYILNLTSRATINNSPRGTGYEFAADEAQKRHFVDNLKIARVVSRIDSGGLVTADTPKTDMPRELSALRYNELRSLASDLGLDSTGKGDEIRSRIAAHMNPDAGEEE